MIRHVLATLLVLAGCSEKTSHGLPPASDWGSASPSPSPPMQRPKEAEPPPKHPIVAEQTTPRQLEKQPDGALKLGPFTMNAPAGWTEKAVTSSMRVAQFTLPAKPGAEAELVIYYFGADGAGSVQDNLDRWVGQFTQPDGKPKIETVKLAGQDATIVSISGHFSAQAMAGNAAVDKDDQALLGAIVASPSGPYYFKLVGAKPTVAANEAKFRDMLKSIKVH
jgi:hypothetical protein